jgi:uncharacterized protein (DUF849 family)
VPLLKACLNGARRPDEHPALPVTPEALARDAAAVVAAGADAVHLHVKDADGADTLNGAALADVLVAVRAAAPGLPAGVTTGAWAAPDPAERVALVRSWPVLPDFASVNWHEDGAEDVAAALLDRGVGVEAGIWHSRAAEVWNGSRHRDACLRVLVELAARRGLATRIGLEDTLVLPDGSPAPDNAALVRAARAIVTECDPARADRDDVAPGG